MITPSALRIHGLAKAFDGHPILGGLDLEVPAGSLTAVLGPSGCGKTTLLRLIAGFEPADAGTITVQGTSVSAPGKHLAPERRRLGYVAQEGALFPHLDVAANIAFGLPRARQRAGRVEQLLDLLGLTGLAKRMPHELSGGQQQRVALARALAPAPALLLLDEPFDALDASLRASVRSEVCAALRAAGATTLLVTHDQEEALSLAELVGVMRDGQIVQAADPRSLYNDPLDPQIAQFLGDAVLLPGRLANGYADSPLGRIATRAPAELPNGPVTIMLRPEQIACRAASGHEPPGSTRGQVISTTFFGHDATVTVALQDPHGPATITARAAARHLPGVGEEVTLLVEGSAVAYPPAPTIPLPGSAPMLPEPAARAPGVQEMARY